MERDLFVARQIDEPWLKFSVRSNLRIMYTIGLMPVYSHESDLCVGRFKHFQYEPQENRVRIYMDHRKQPFRIRLTEMVNWIAEHNTGAWNLDIDMENLNEGKFFFSFEDYMPAFMFKMVFG